MSCQKALSGGGGKQSPALGPGPPACRTGGEGRAHEGKEGQRRPKAAEASIGTGKFPHQRRKDIDFTGEETPTGLGPPHSRCIPAAQTQVSAKGRPGNVPGPRVSFPRFAFTKARERHR